MGLEAFGQQLQLQQQQLQLQQQQSLSDFRFINAAGRRFSTVRLKALANGEVIVAAGTHDEPQNTVNVWDANGVRDPKSADALLNEDGFVADSSVSYAEFWADKPGDLKLWVGTSKGSVKLLKGSKAESRMDGEVSQSWQLEEVCHVQSDQEQSGKGLHQLAATSLAVHPTTTTVLSAGEDGAIFQLQPEASGQVKATAWNQSADWVALYDIKYHPAGLSFFTAGAAGGVRSWDTRSRGFSTLSEGGSGAGYLSVEPVENHVLAATEAGGIHIFDIRREKQALAYIYESDALEDGFHSASVWAIRRCSGDDEMFLSCSTDGTVLSFVPQLQRDRPHLIPRRWHRYSQGVNDVDAVLCDAGQRSQHILTMAAADSGLLFASSADSEQGI